VCGKFDEFAAIERGIDASVVITNKRDACSSFDDLYILSKASKDVLASLDAVDISYYSIPSTPDYFVAMPGVMLRPERGNKAFRFVGGKCKACLRSKEVIWGPEPVVLPDGLVLGMYLFENPTVGLSPAWIGSERVVRTLKSARLKGWEFVDL
jgi:hypothetical protein